MQRLIVGVKLRRTRLAISEFSVAQRSESNPRQLRRDYLFYLNQEVIKPVRLEIPILLVSALSFSFFLNGLNIICGTGLDSDSSLLPPLAFLPQGYRMERPLTDINSLLTATWRQREKMQQPFTFTHITLPPTIPTRFDANNGMFINFFFHLYCGFLSKFLKKNKTSLFSSQCGIEVKPRHDYGR